MLARAGGIGRATAVQLQHQQIRNGSSWAGGAARRQAGEIESAKRASNIEEFAKAHNIKFKASGKKGGQEKQQNNYPVVAGVSVALAFLAGASISNINSATHEPIRHIIEGKKIITRRLSSLTGYPPPAGV